MTVSRPSSTKDFERVKIDEWINGIIENIEERFDVEKKRGTQPLHQSDICKKIGQSKNSQDTFRKRIKKNPSNPASVGRIRY